MYRERDDTHSNPRQAAGQITSLSAWTTSLWFRPFTGLHWESTRLWITMSSGRSRTSPTQCMCCMKCMSCLEWVTKLCSRMNSGRTDGRSFAPPKQISQGSIAHWKATIVLTILVQCVIVSLDHKGPQWKQGFCAIPLAPLYNHTTVWKLFFFPRYLETHPLKDQSIQSINQSIEEM